MRVIDGIQYINEKEASNHFGYSRSWFAHMRYAHKGPTFIKMKSGRIYYELTKINEWFKNQIELNEF